MDKTNLDERNSLEKDRPNNARKNRRNEAGRAKIKDLLKQLQRENIQTWFDLSLYLDRLKDERKLKPRKFHLDKPSFLNEVADKGVAFITFEYAIDGVTVECQKYAHALQLLIKEKTGREIPQYFVASQMTVGGQTLLKEYATSFFKIKEMQPFNQWPLYESFFFKKLVRGGKEYNLLIKNLLEETFVLVKKLGNYILEKDPALLYLVNVGSNPGNVSLSLACVLLSELLDYPVINNCHDYYFEKGNKPADIENKLAAPGDRDFFFCNYHLGEVFSIIHMLYPWKSPLWFTLNINSNQNQLIVTKKGHSPASVSHLSTAVDNKTFGSISKRERVKTLIKLEHCFTKNKKHITKESLGTNCTSLENYFSFIDKNKDQLREKFTTKHHQLSPVLLGKKNQNNLKLVKNTILILQPTRILKRKRIERIFDVAREFFNQESFLAKLRESEELKICIVISGPMARENFDYYLSLLKQFKLMLSSLKKEHQDRAYLGFLFGHFDNLDDEKIRLHHLYQSSSLIVLLSNTEGRGLPIIEANASGIPILTCRYDPEAVYSEVVGEHLDKKNRLSVLEIKDSLNSTLMNELIKIIFSPHLYAEKVQEKRKVVAKRFSIDLLKKEFEQVLHKVYRQLNPLKENNDLTELLIKSYARYLRQNRNEVKELLDFKNRPYIAGTHYLGTMVYLKSLIDPSHFRIEEDEMAGLIFKYAHNLFVSNKNDHVKGNPFSLTDISDEAISFFQAIENLFCILGPDITTVLDHSIAYRHRSKKGFIYYNLTPQEMLGIVDRLLPYFFEKKPREKFYRTPYFFIDTHMALMQLSNANFLCIDQRKRLIRWLGKNVPMAYFPENYIQHETELFITERVRTLLKLSIKEDLTKEILEKNKKKIAKTYIFVNEKKSDLPSQELINYMQSGASSELKLIYKYDLLEIIPTTQHCPGIHLRDLGKKATEVLVSVKNNNGFLLCFGEYDQVMSDAIDIDRFCIGKTNHPLTSNLLGIKEGDGFISFAIASSRVSISYPTPLQTLKVYDEALCSPLFSRLEKKMGENALLKAVRKENIKQDLPLMEILKKIESEEKKKNKSAAAKDLEVLNLSGTYNDGLPWNGVVAKLSNLDKRKWDFKCYTNADHPKSAPKLLEEMQKKMQKARPVRVMWNGGYILNPELVGKLVIDEKYIGSPLGLLIENGRINSLPLFNKGAIFFLKDGSVKIDRVNTTGGFILQHQEKKWEFSHKNRNKVVADQLCFFDLMHETKKIVVKNHYVVRLSGLEIKEIIPPPQKNPISLIPVGITLLIPKKFFPKNWKRDTRLEAVLHNPKDWKEGFSMSEISYAVEAGPVLLSKGEQDIKMKTEGWKMENSIKTQAARTDYTHMRGPKIACGLTEKELFILVINGRLRESVGATHVEMAKTLKQMGAKKALAFDPGGSCTLWVNGIMQNISPYNAEYEKNEYSLPGKPRFISTIITAG